MAPASSSRIRHCEISLARHPEKADEPRAVRGQHFLVDTRPVIEALGVANRRKLREVVIPLVGGSDHPEMVVGIRDAPATLLETRPKRHVALEPDDGLDPGLLARRRPPHGPEHRPMVGDGHGRHPHGLRMLGQFVEMASPVEKRELGVEVEVDELGSGHEGGGSLAGPSGYEVSDRRSLNRA
jgi:hypothetical protein